MFSIRKMKIILLKITENDNKRGHLIERERETRRKKTLQWHDESSLNSWCSCLNIWAIWAFKGTCNSFDVTKRNDIVFATTNVHSCIGNLITIFQIVSLHLFCSMAANYFIFFLVCLKLLKFRKKHISESFI